MSRILFENKKAALGFAGAIVMAALVFSGTSGGSDESSNREQSGFAEAAPEANTAAKARTSETQEREEIAFADDEELIDNTGGFDPSPGGSSEVEEGDPEPEESSDKDEDGKGGFGDFDEDGYLKLDDEF